MFGKRNKRNRRRQTKRTARYPGRLMGGELLENRALLTAAPFAAQFIVNDAVYGEQRVSEAADAVASGPSGEFVIVFDGQGPGDDQGVFAQTYAADGSTTGSVIRVNTLTRGPQQNAAVGMADDGSFWVAYSGQGGSDRTGVYAQRFAADGSRLGDELLVNSTVGGDQTQPVVGVAGDGSAVVVWQGVGSGDTSGVFLQRIAADGTLLGDETQVASTTVGEQAGPSVAVDAEGKIFVAWSSRHQDGDGWGVYARRFAEDGSALGDELLVNSTTASSQHEASIGAAADGSFAVAWSNFGSGGDWDVMARQFNNDGTAAGDEFLVNESSSGHQLHPSLAMADSGQSFITWSHGVEDGSGWEVMARSFTSDGVADSDSFLVNTGSHGVNSGHQEFPSISVSDDGSGVVAFSGDGPLDHSGVYSQQFETDSGTSNDAPELAPISDQQLAIGEPMVLTLTATDADNDDTLTFMLDEANSPAGAILTQTDNNTATLSWTPAAEDRGTPVSFVVNVSDDGNPSLSDSQSFEVTVSNQAPLVDLNGGNQDGADTTAALSEGQGPVALVDSGLLEIADGDDGQLASARVVITNLLNGTAEALSVDTTGTNIAASYDSATGTLTLSGTDSLTNYESVLGTLTYDNGATVIDATTRTISVIVSDAFDDSTAANISLQINAIPKLASVADQNITTGETFQQTIIATDANAGETLTFQLDPDDAPDDATLTQIDNNTATVSWVTTTGDAGQSFLFRVLVTDNGDPALSNSESFVVTVTNAAPVVDLNGDDQEGIDFATSFTEGQGPVVLVDSDMTVSDLDHSQLGSAQAELTNPLNGTDESLAVDTSGTSIVSSYDSATGVLSLSGVDSLASYEAVLRTLRYDNSASNPDTTGRIVTVRVNDGAIDSLVASVALEVRAIGANDDPVTTSEDAAEFTLDVLDNDVFPGGVITQVGAPDKGGSVSIATDGLTLLYQPAADFFGVETFTYEVNDGATTEQATVTITVQPTNDNPTAEDDLDTVQEDSIDNILLVLGNDSFSPDEGEVLTISGVGAPDAGGTATVAGDMLSLLYSPDADFFGTEQVTYTISDGNGGTATATVTITVEGVNDDPVAEDDVRIVQEDSTDNLITAILDNDRFAPDVGEVLTIIGVTDPDEGGTIAISADKLSLIYTPLPNFIPSENVIYTISDGNGGTATATLTIGVFPSNDPPTAEPDTPTVIENSTDNVLTVLSNDSFAPDVNETLTITAVGTTDSGGSVTIAPDDLSLRYTPATDFAGTEMFSYTISDGHGGTDTATVSVTVNAAPELTVPENVTLLSGSPLHIPLDGFDAEGEALTFTATINDESLVTGDVLAGNRSMRILVTGFGEMVFELFEQRAPRVTEQIISLADSDFYNGIIFHRVDDGFVIQGGDPTGTGSGGSTLGDFDDQFHVDLQHNQTGMLSMAKSGDDTNDSQFFIIEGTTRFLDFNHSIFGQLVEGEDVREAISGVEVVDADGPDNIPNNGDDDNRPVEDVVMQDVEIFVDEENGVMMLKAAEGLTGSTTVTVTAMDIHGGTTERTINVTVEADTSNGGPFLVDIPLIQTTASTATFQLSAIDVEGDDVFFDAASAGTIDYTFEIDNDTGEVTVTPPSGFTGTLEILVGVRPLTVSDTQDTFDSQTVMIEFS